MEHIIIDNGEERNDLTEQEVIEKWHEGKIYACWRCSTRQRIVYHNELHEQDKSTK